MIDSTRLIIFFAGMILFAVAEFVEPRAVRSRPRTERWTVNIGFAIMNSIVLRLGIGSLFLGWVTWLDTHHWGLLGLVEWPMWIEVFLVIVALDASFYLFHIIMHHWHFAWRFHLVHHTDLDLDFSSASRFHVGELALSMVYTALIAVILGAPLAGVVAYEAAKLFAAQFNHSNLKLPRWLEQGIGWIFVTPAIHWVHHSVIVKETNANYANIFSWWDRMFGTFRGEADMAKITIGLPEYRNAGELNFVPLFMLPLKKWKERS